MAVDIIDTGTASFTINGVTFLKNFQSLVISNSIRIVNAYDSKLILLESTEYTEFTINGSAFANVLLLQQALVSILFNRPATGAGLLETNNSNTLFFHSTAGVRHGTWSVPILGNLAINTVGAVEGGVVVIIWRGDSNPTFSGGVIQSYGGEITRQDTYSIYVHYLNGRFNINIFNADGESTGDTLRPATMTILSVNNYVGNDTTPPVKMNILSVSSIDETPPAQMEILTIT